MINLMKNFVFHELNYRLFEPNNVPFELCLKVRLIKQTFINVPFERTHQIESPYLFLLHISLQKTIPLNN